MPRRFLWRVFALIVALLPLGAGTPVAAQEPADRTLDAVARDVLQRYSAALASLDADAVKKVQPSIDVDTLKQAFKQMRSLDVAIDNVRVLSSGSASMRVSCRVTQTLTPKAGAKQTTTVTRVMQLRKQEALWIIEGFER
ncbi:MAG TPA: hypothetical protein VFX12_02230 [Vicinamibacterales bacterium]|nr:hypothetical protein [Vicinamibacterales bacterium]